MPCFLSQCDNRTQSKPAVLQLQIPVMEQNQPGTSEVEGNRRSQVRLRKMSWVMRGRRVCQAR
jgi:hypothetical protein